MTLVIGFDKILLPPSNTIFTNLLLQRSLNKCMSWYHFLNSQLWIVKTSKSDATNKKYDSCFSKFKSWWRQFNLECLPAKASTVTIYLTNLIQSGCSASVLNSNFYAVKWYHDMHLFDLLFLTVSVTENVISWRPGIRDKSWISFHSKVTWK
jgi:hypothetical protein